MLQLLLCCAVSALSTTTTFQWGKERVAAAANGTELKKWNHLLVVHTALAYTLNERAHTIGWRRSTTFDFRRPNGLTIKTKWNHDKIPSHKTSTRNSCHCREQTGIQIIICISIFLSLNRLDLISHRINKSDKSNNVSDLKYYIVIYIIIEHTTETMSLSKMRFHLTDVMKARIIRHHNNAIDFFLLSNLTRFPWIKKNRVSIWFRGKRSIPIAKVSTIFKHKFTFDCNSPKTQIRHKVFSIIFFSLTILRFTEQNFQIRKMTHTKKN